MSGLRLRRREALGLIGGALAISGSASAAETADYSWRSVRIGGGGFIPGIVFSRAEKGLAYLRSDMGGAYRWDLAAGAWSPLQDAMAQSSYMGVESIAPDPVDPEVVYAAVGMSRREPAAILRSRDRGRSWRETKVAFRMGGNEDGRGLGERLAIDPNLTSVLYFGSRHDGLQRSLDAGRSWSKVERFPAPGRGVQADRTNAGVSFVLFAPQAGRGRESEVVLAGVADPETAGIYRSDDAGRSWRRLAAPARDGLLPVKAEIDERGVLYSTWCDGIGPNGVTDGAVLRLDLRSGAWRDITPDRRPQRPAGGYMGVAVDRLRPGVVAVSTMNRWEGGGDTVWISRDDGESWTDVKPASRRYVDATPFLRWGEREADFGWWIAALAIDPFDSGHFAYATGATVYSARTDPADREIVWRPWVEGVEQTAVLALASPAHGPRLLSGLGDISGFAHEDLAVSPVAQFTSPLFANTNNIDVAPLRPEIVVRSGTPPHRGEGEEPTLAWSQDGGRTWSPLRAPRPRRPWPKPPEGRPRRRASDPVRDAAIVVSADGATFTVTTPTPVFTRDRGTTWKEAQGLPPYARPVPDRVDPGASYALDFASGEVFASGDGGATFQPQSTRGLPGELAADRPTWREEAWPLLAAPGRAGELWLASRAGLFRSQDGGRSFERRPGGVQVEILAFGRPRLEGGPPTLFAIGRRGDLRAIWRSDDEAGSWIRINDDAHQYGRRFRCLCGDPRTSGRVYIGTDGRGVLVGEPRQGRA